MMEQSQTNSRTPFSGEPGNQVRPLASTTEATVVEPPKQRSSPETGPIENMSLSATMDTHMANVPSGPQQQPQHQQQSMSLGGSSGVQQPKVQTAFIHKLYKYFLHVLFMRRILAGWA